MAPVGYTVMCFAAGGALADRLGEILATGGETAYVPIVGEVSVGYAVWILAMCVGLAMTTPPIVVFTVESHFAKRIPELVFMGRRAVWSVLTGVTGTSPAAPAGPEEDEEMRWKRLLA